MRPFPPLRKWDNQSWIYVDPFWYRNKSVWDLDDSIYDLRRPSRIKTIPYKIRIVSLKIAMLLPHKKSGRFILDWKNLVLDYDDWDLNSLIWNCILHCNNFISSKIGTISSRIMDFYWNLHNLDDLPYVLRIEYVWNLIILKKILVEWQMIRLGTFPSSIGTFLTSIMANWRMWFESSCVGMKLSCLDL